MASERFYERLPVCDDFASICELANYHAIPDDWHVAVADVQGSTEAIERGAYKQVNIIGAASIAAVLNAVEPVQVPYVFGGDGAIICVPNSVVARAGAALLATRKMAHDEFGLTLRVGAVPMHDIRENGHRVMITCFRVSPHYRQAVFTGGGLQYAESCVKDVGDDRTSHYALCPENFRPAGSFAGLECRWDDIPSPHGETITLLVGARSPDLAQATVVYRDVMDAIGRIYGDADMWRPVRLDLMRLTRSNEKLSVEASLRSHGRSWLGRQLYWLWLKAQMAIGHVVFPRRMTFAGVDWGRYQDDVVTNTDFRKFDDMLRLVLSGTATQREQLTGFLDAPQNADRLAYGLHVADAALMTCLIFNREGEHVHFVDGAAGGYAIASRKLKERRKSTA